MDYITKPTSRKELRKFSKVFRFLFRVTDDNSPFPVLNALEILPDVFKGTTLSIVEDNDLPPNVPARCFPDEYGNFTIEIKETVYKGAFEKQIGAYLDFICHEICHIFLFKIGFTPVVERSFGNNENDCERDPDINHRIVAHKCHLLFRIITYCIKECK